MKQEFTTLYGKAIVERGVLHFRSPYLPFYKTAFAEIGYEILWLSWFPLRLFTSDKPMDYFVAGVIGILVLTRIPTMFDKFLKRSYSSRIPLSWIVSVDTADDDPHGLHITVRLFLKSGRYKKIRFRKLENQHEPFVVSLSQHSSVVVA